MQTKVQRSRFSTVSQHQRYHQLPSAELIAIRFEEQKRGNHVHTLRVENALDGCAGGTRGCTCT